MPTKFFNNNEENNLFNHFKGIAGEMPSLHAFHAVVGYFRSSGYFELRPILKDIPSIKILVGINVDKIFRQAHQKGRLYFNNPTQTKKEFLRAFTEDVRQAKYAEEVERGILEFVRDLMNGRVEVRAHGWKSIVHAKFYLFLPKAHTPHSDGWVIMGSSNLTRTGLGVKQPPNYELNIALKDYDDVAFAKSEFEQLWQEATEILPADMEAAQKGTHLGQSFTPFEIYMKLLIAYFGDRIDYDPETVGDLPKGYKKLSYQLDAVNEGFQMLNRHHGFFLADVVGLGKTLVATMIAKKFLIENGSHRTKILVVYPPALEKNWKSTFQEFGIHERTRFITNGSLDKILDKNHEKHIDYWKKEAYDLILVDEAHKYRNHKSDMFTRLQQICKAPRSQAGGIKGKKRVILISATPLNNKPEDLYHQLQLFQDAKKSTLPITNLADFFDPINKAYKEIIKKDAGEKDRERSVQKISKLYQPVREKVIVPLTVRRTRTDLESTPQYKKDLISQGIKFPDIELESIRYELSDKVSGLFQQTIHALTDKNKIGYFRYRAIAYLTDDLKQAHYERADFVSDSLAGIIKTLLVKRLESSFNAFKITMNNLFVATERMMEMFEEGKVFIAPGLNIQKLIDQGRSTEEIEELVKEINDKKPDNKVFEAKDFGAEFLPGLQADKKLLEALVCQWNEVTEDPKLRQLIHKMNTELFDAEKNGEGRLVIFTESNDTAKYLEKELKNYPNKGVLKVSAQNRGNKFADIQKNFDANYPTGKREDKYQILITTDVLAEGINLHRANVIINYDTPWNATKLMQRVGRVNRIGGRATKIYNYSFYPSQQGDQVIQLHHKALTKLQGFHSAYGEDTKIFTPEEMVEQFELFKQGQLEEKDKRLHYLQVIRDYKAQHPAEYERIKKIPMKARTARSSQEVKKAAPNTTLVFLRSSYKEAFYYIDEKSKVHEVDFLEAARRFEAQAQEPGFGIPPCITNMHNRLWVNFIEQSWSHPRTPYRQE